MSNETIHKQLSTQPDPRVQLAFERTFLAYERTRIAWVRTALALISFGFAIAKSDLKWQNARLRSPPAQR